MMINKINQIIISYIKNVDVKNRDSIIKALHVLLNGNYEKYNFYLDAAFSCKTNDELQKILYTLNEKTECRKSDGVYYTPEDVCKYIILNSMIMFLDEKNSKTYKEKDAINFISKYNEVLKDELIFKKTFIDPTCGSGEFLINVFKVKIEILKTYKENYNDSDIFKIAKTLFGNDISEESTDISKIRLFIEIGNFLSDKHYYLLLSKALKKQFTNIDYVLYNDSNNNKFDFVVGNPPYVEYGKYSHKEELSNNFGNIYANVIQNGIKSLKNGGVLGFVVPLSYIATSRMNNIRSYVRETTNRQFILNFADRPDCLFQGVHQKLNIIVLRKGKQEHALFTSNYKHWYKEERANLLNGCEIKENHHIDRLFIPKIGNAIEENIYRKVFTSTQKNIFDLQTSTGKPIFLNMRACFWIKSFSFNPGSNEYKRLFFGEDIADFINCVLNSSLFWLYWTIVSDCWHITSKELKGFLIPNIDSKTNDKCKILINNLEDKLEKTKKFIGTKQVDYEYKHKECKKEIDSIDNLLSKVYQLTDKELEYIKKFALKYRTGGNSND